MTPRLLEFDKVTKIYPTREGTICALQDVSFTIAEGGFTSIVGPSGCGKSTALMLVAGLIKKSSGRILISGQEVTKPQTDLGVVFQTDVLLEWRDVLDNVLLAAEAPHRDRRKLESTAHELLASVGLEGFENNYPYELSGGMRQRVALCRGLLINPSLILMDEPFGSLDAITRDQLSIDLQRLWKTYRSTVLFITHDISEAVFLSDQVIVMTPRPGRIDKVIDIDLPRPRTLAMRESREFAAFAGAIRASFLERGILREETD